MIEKFFRMVCETNYLQDKVNYSGNLTENI